jgi:gliding motility-associated-like protein
MLTRIKRLKNVLVIMALLITNNCFPQGKEANIWYFGWGAGLDFNQGSPPSALTNSQMYTQSGNIYGCASIADSLGNLLFYSDGTIIWNKDHQIMQNGTGVGDFSTQGAVIVPLPSNSNIYYFFSYEYVSNGHYNLQYSIIDMQLDNGRGAVLSDKKGIDILTESSFHLNAVHHSNQKDIWVLSHTAYTNYYYAFLINTDSINTSPIISQAGSLVEDIPGYMKISPKGNLLAIATAYGPNPFMEILSFDNTTGQVDDSFQVHDPNGASAVEFSSDNTKLYSICGFLHQYDLTSGNPDQILNSRMVISTEGGSSGGIQIATDGKIYVCFGDSYYLHVVHEPNEPGLNCNFEEFSVYLGGRMSTDCLPTFIQSYMADPEFETTNNCLGDPTEFSILQTNGMDSVFWKFNDFPNMPYDTSTLFNPTYTFSFADTFLVELTAYSNLNVRTVTQEVVIHPIPEPDLGNDTLLCDTSFTITLNANCEGDVFAWNTGQFGTPEITISDTGLYVVIVSKNGCSNSDSIYIGLYPQTEVDTSGLVIIPASCGVANGSITGLQVNGTEPLLYFWLDITGDTIGFDLDIDNLNAGIYTLHVSDGNGCANNIGSYIVTDDGMMQVDSVQHTNDHCSQLGATIQVFAQEIGTGTISYSIDGGITYLQNDGVFTDLSAGTYNVMIIDENNCEGIYQNNPVVIQNIPGPEVTSVIVLPEEDYGQNGQIDMQAIVSWGNAFYSIDNGLNFQQGNGLFINLSAGTYICVVQDTFGCDTTFQIIVGHIVTTPLEAIAGNGTTCIGNAVVSPLQLNYFNEVKSFQVKLTYDFDLVRCDGYINLNPEFEQGFSASIIPDIGEIFLFWEGESPLSLPEYAAMTELVFSALLDGNSAVNWQSGPGESEFLDQYGQQLNVEYHTGNLRIYTRPEIEMLIEQEICVGETISIHPIVEGGSGEKTYFWSGPGGFQSNDSILSLSSIQADQQGLYTLHVYDTLQCDDASSFQLFVHPLPEIAFAPYDTLYVEPGYELHAGNGYRDYLWNTGEQAESIIVDSSGEYSVQVTSYNDCVATETVQIRWSAISIYLPNAFTPDGDGLNDVFIPVVRYDFIATYHMYIFNRWGQMIFESSDMQHGWDGTYKGKPVAGGIYVYRIDYTVSGSQSQKSETLTGNVVLVR